MTSIGRRMVVGAGWMVLFKLCHRGIGIVSMLILARLLVPEDFGVVAMATTLIAMVELLRAFSFEVMLIQERDATKAEFDSVWTLNIVFAIGIGGLVALMAVPGAAFYKEPRVEYVLYALAISTCISGLENVGVVRFRKDLEYDKEFIYQVGRKLIGFMATIPLAIWLRNYWALAFGMLLGNIGSVAFSFLYCRYRPSLTIVSARKVIGFSKWLMLNNFLFFLHARSIDFVVGRLVGASGLGALSVAQEVSSIPTNEIAQPVNRAVLPGYAKLNDDVGALRAAYLSVASAVALLVVPAGFGLSLTADLVVPVLFGSAWHEAVVPVQVLSMVGALVAIQTNSGIAYMALGRLRLLTGTTILSIGVMLPLVVVMTMWLGLKGAVLGQLMAVLVMLPVNYYWVMRILGIDLRSLIARLWRPFAATVVMVVVCHFTRVNWLGAGSEVTAWLTLAGTVAIGVVTYTLSVWGFWLLAGSPDGGEKFVIERVQGLRQRLSERWAT